MTPPESADQEVSSLAASASAEPELARRNGADFIPLTSEAPTEANGAVAPGSVTDQPVDRIGSQPEEPSTLERAEELADQIGSQVGMIAAVLGRTVLRWAARTREAVEDCWAEAQDIRKRKKNEPPAS